MNNNSSKVILREEGYPAENLKIEGYHDAKWYNAHIYGLFSGRSMDKLAQSSALGKKKPSGGNLLKMFDENGNIIRTYYFDYFINGSSNRNNKIIEITSNSDDPLIIFPLN